MNNGEVKPSNFEYSEMRKKLNKAHLEIIHSRQYRGARESDVVSWLADYVENNFIATSAYQSLQKENEVLKARVGVLENSIRQVRNSIAIGTWNVDERFAKFAVDVSKNFEKALKEGLDGK